MESVRAIIHDQDILCIYAKKQQELHFMSITEYLTVLFETKVTEEMFTGENPEVSHLNFFGCPIYLHVPKEKRSKLDPLRKKGIFDGYCEQSKAYRIYIPGFC